MCTLTWIHTAQTEVSDSKENSQNSGYKIHFNRDESRQRSKALPPQLLTNKEVAYLAPIDQDAKGTWVFVNSWGFSVCLLNNYIDIPVSDNGRSSRGRRSRGLLVKDLSHVKNIQQALHLLNAIEIGNYAPFDMYLFDFQQVYAISWNGKSRSDISDPAAFKSSSGFNAKKVIHSRKKHFLQSQAANSSLRDFHRSHTPDKSAYSVCMHRSDASTQSYTEISVSPRDASICYTEGPPCKAALSTPLSLPLYSLSLETP